MDGSVERQAGRAQVRTGVDGDLVVGADDLARPAWAATDPLLRRYYDQEWGCPVLDEQGMFERVSLEVFQSGLSWRVVLARRDGLRRAFHGFDPQAVAAMGRREVERVLADPAVIRNRRKVLTTIANAAAVVAMRGQRCVPARGRPCGPAAATATAGGPGRAGVVPPSPCHPVPTSCQRGSHPQRGVGGTGGGAQGTRARRGRAHHDVRPHGGGRRRRHPSRRLPPEGVVGGVVLSRPHTSGRWAPMRFAEAHSAAGHSSRQVGTLTRPNPVNRPRRGGAPWAVAMRRHSRVARDPM